MKYIRAILLCSMVLLLTACGFTNSKCAIKKDVEHLKEQLTQIKNINDSIARARTLLETGEFKALRGALYQGSSIYKEQMAYVERVSPKDIYEYCESIEVSSVNWTYIILKKFPCKMG